MSTQRTFTYMHQYDLGAPLSDDDINTHVRNARGSAVLTAVLQLLRNEAARVDTTGRQPPAELHVPGDYRSYHDGGADGLEEVFRKLHAMAESAIPEDEGGAENDG